MTALALPGATPASVASCRRDKSLEPSQLLEERASDRRRDVETDEPRFMATAYLSMIRREII